MLYEQNRDALMTYALSALQVGCYERASACFHQLLEYDPQQWEARYLLAQSLHKQQRINSARVELTHIVEQSPCESLRRRALMYLKEVLYSEQSLDPTSPLRLGGN